MTHRVNDGGPAFAKTPWIYQESGNVPDHVGAEGQKGMSLLEYFAAHAPPPPEWFEPKMEPKPKRDPKWKWCKACHDELDHCDGDADCKKIIACDTAVDNWNWERLFQLSTQWPWIYAAGVLAARNIATAPTSTTGTHPDAEEAAHRG